MIGAGSMSSLAAATLVRAGVGELVVANRTVDRAERLAQILTEPGGPGAANGLTARAVAMTAVADELTRADVVVSCTGATGLVLAGRVVAAALAEREAPLALLDLAMPRDIDAAVHRIDGAHLVDIESLADASADAPMAADVDQVRGIVSDEVAAFGAAQRAAHITPTVVALRTMAADVVAGEIARLDGRLPDLDDKQRGEITQTVRRVVDKLLHAPTVRVKQLAERARRRRVRGRAAGTLRPGPPDGRRRQPGRHAGRQARGSTGAGMTDSTIESPEAGHAAQQARHGPVRTGGRGGAPGDRARPSSWWRSPPTATPPASTSRRSAAPGSSSPPCATRCCAGRSTSPSTRSRTCRPRSPTTWCWPPCRCARTRGTR